jgi:hypothetical protein
MWDACFLIHTTCHLVIFAGLAGMQPFELVHATFPFFCPAIYGVPSLELCAIEYSLQPFLYETYPLYMQVVFRSKWSWQYLPPSRSAKKLIRVTSLSKVAYSYPMVSPFLIMDCTPLETLDKQPVLI